MNVQTIFRGYDFSFSISTDNDAVDLSTVGARLFDTHTRTRVEADVEADAQTQDRYILKWPAALTAQMPIGKYNLEIYNKTDGVTLYHCEPFAVAVISSAADSVNILPSDESESEA